MIQHQQTILANYLRLLTNMLRRHAILGTKPHYTSIRTIGGASELASLVAKSLLSLEIVFSSSSLLVPRPYPPPPGSPAYTQPGRRWILELSTKRALFST